MKKSIFKSFTISAADGYVTNRIDMREIMRGPIKLAAAFVFCALGGAVQAQPFVEALGHFQDWDSYRSIESGKSYCYILSTPKSGGTGNAHISITNWSKRGFEDQVNIAFEGPIDPSNPVKAVIDGHKMFELQGHSSTGGWFADVEREKEFVEHLKKGQWLDVKATGVDDEKIQYRFSLFGATAAHKALASSCT